MDFFFWPVLPPVLPSVCISIRKKATLCAKNSRNTWTTCSTTSATLAVYLDVYNVFVSLLQLIMAFTGDRD